MYDASDRKQVRAAEKASARVERNRGEVLVALAGTEPGRRWLWEELESAHIFTTPYSADTNQTYFNLGVQNTGLRLLSDLMRWCPDQFIQAMREANARRTEHTDRPDRTAGEHRGSEEPGREPEEPSGEPASN